MMMTQQMCEKQIILRYLGLAQAWGVRTRVFLKTFFDFVLVSLYMVPIIIIQSVKAALYARRLLTF